MKNIKVKICGIRSKESAIAAVNAHADFLGFNFVPHTTRFIDVLTAQNILSSVRGKIPVVGVFMNQQITYVNEIIDVLQLDYVQLHGNEDMDYVKSLHTPVIKTFSFSKEIPFGDINLLINSYNVAYYLLDITKGDSTTILSYLKEIEQIKDHEKLFLSGGITSENIQTLLTRINPYGVDVARGIESDGKDDPKKIETFVRLVKRSNLTQTQ